MNVCVSVNDWLVGDDRKEEKLDSKAEEHHNEKLTSSMDCLVLVNSNCG